MRLTLELASSLAEFPLRGICREYPNKLDHVINGPNDLRSPRQLHPAFYGCFDWHSAVHCHWMLIYLLKQFDLPNADKIRTLLWQNLTADNIAAEAAYLAEPNRQSFERPYGWSWLLKLAEELNTWNDDDGKRWSARLRPLENGIVERYLDFLPKQDYPVRTGTHSNTAFGLTFAYDYALALGNSELELLIEDRAISYFAADKGYPTSQEPGGADFLSPCLCEADLMRRIMPGDQFQDWLHQFLPELSTGEADGLLTPVEVSDRTDPQIGHLDGLNLSRAWCLASIGSALPADDALRTILLDSANRHADHGISHVATGDYMGEHWLASFAVNMTSVFQSLAAGRVE